MKSVDVNFVRGVWIRGCQGDIGHEKVGFSMKNSLKDSDGECRFEVVKVTTGSKDRLLDLTMKSVDVRFVDVRFVDARLVDSRLSRRQWVIKVGSSI